MAVSGEVACRGRGQVLEWLRASRGRAHSVAALELRASESHLLLGIDDASLPELASVRLAASRRRPGKAS
ncbi:MAG: hypothetical protein ACRDL2_12120 [Gaiellaceae bacterium]